ncbi:MAG: hypothetical protein ABJI69_00165 [Balneola sp.]
MSGCIGNGHGINAWETQEPEEIVAGRNHIAHLLNQEQEGAYQVDEVPLMPFGPYKNKQLNELDRLFLRDHFHNGNFEAYPDCKYWIEKNLITKSSVLNTK